MATQTVEQVQRLAPYLEGLEKRLLGTAFGEFDASGAQTQPGLLDKPIALPQQQVAGLDPLQAQALSMAPGMVGSYAPFTLGAAGQTLGGQAALAGGLGMLQNPAAAIQQYMNPYQSNVINEINRQAQMEKNKLAGASVQAGAFGGSRQGIQQAEAEGRTAYGWSWSGIRTACRYNRRHWPCTVRAWPRRPWHAYTAWRYWSHLPATTA